MALSDEEARRYARHALLPEIGRGGQERLRRSAVLIVGAGGLGAAAISYLAAAGIGTLGLIDHDSVELSNLNRQIVHEEGDIGRRKVESAADRVAELNSGVKVRTYPHRFEDLGEAALEAYDLVIDGSDRFATRFAVAEACASARKPLVSAAVRAFSAQLSTFKPYLGAPHPCYRCFVPELPGEDQDCAARGILGPLVGVMGSLQAIEAIKELLGIGRSLSGRLIRYDALAARWSEARLRCDPECTYCGDERLKTPFA